MTSAPVLNILQQLEKLINEHAPEAVVPVVVVNPCKEVIQVLYLVPAITVMVYQHLWFKYYIKPI